MTKRPTYAELSRKVAEFEAEAARRRRAEVALRASEARLVENLKESYFLFSQIEIKVNFKNIKQS